MGVMLLKALTSSSEAENEVRFEADWELGDAPMTTAFLFMPGGKNPGPVTIGLKHLLLKQTQPVLSLTREDAYVRNDAYDVAATAAQS